MPQPIFYLAMFGLSLCIILCFYRVGRGPSPADRTSGITLLSILVASFAAVMSVFTGKSYYVDIGIAWAIINYLGSLLMAKYLEGKRFDA